MIGYCNPKREVSRLSDHNFEPARSAMTIPTIPRRMGSLTPAFFVLDFERTPKSQLHAAMLRLGRQIV